MHFYVVAFLGRSVDVTAQLNLLVGKIRITLTDCASGSSSHQTQTPASPLRCPFIIGFSLLHVIHEILAYVPSDWKLRREDMLLG